MKSLLLELKKTKHHKMYLVSLALLLIQYLWTLYAEGKNKDLVQGWLILFYDFPLLNSIMVPTFIAIMASRLIDIEHKGSTWKLLETLQAKTNIFFGKVIYGFCFLLCFCLLQLIMILLLGRSFGYYGNPDLWACALYFIQTLVISFLLFLMQMTLSILFTNQAVFHKCRHLRQHGRIILNVRALDFPATASAMGTFWSCHVRRHGLGCCYKELYLLLFEQT